MTRKVWKIKMIQNAATGICFLFLKDKKVGSIFCSAVLCIKREDEMRNALTLLDVEIKMRMVTSPGAHPPTTFSKAVTATILELAISDGVSTY